MTTSFELILCGEIKRSDFITDLIQHQKHVCTLAETNENVTKNLGQLSQKWLP